MDNRRRLVIAFGTLASIPRTVLAQVGKPPVLLGLLSNGTPNERTLAAFNEGMAALGWKEGATYMLEARWSDGVRERLPSLAAELAGTRPAVIVAATASATIAAAKAAPQVPIVQAQGSSPVAQGLAASLGHPGGMVTGLTNIITEVSEKYLELLLAAAPKLKRVGILIDRRTPGYAAHMKNARRALEHFQVEGSFAEVGKADEVEPAIARFAKEGVEGLVVVPSGGTFSSVRQRIITLSLQHRWPVIGTNQSIVESGALLSYTADPTAQYRRAAYYVDRILKGTKPGDLPIEQPMTFDLVVNLKAAKALGLTMPPEIMVRATRVIE